MEKAKFIVAEAKQGRRGFLISSWYELGRRDCRALGITDGDWVLLERDADKQGIKPKCFAPSVAGVKRRLSSEEAFLLVWRGEAEFLNAGDSRYAQWSTAKAGLALREPYFITARTLPAWLAAAEFVRVNGQCPRTNRTFSIDGLPERVTVKWDGGTSPVEIGRYYSWSNDPEHGDTDWQGGTSVKHDPELAEQFADQIAAELARIRAEIAREAQYDESANAAIREALPSLLNQEVNNIYNGVMYAP